MHDIVKYHNDMNNVSFVGFKEKELDLFFSLCFKAKEQGTNMIKIDFSELKTLSDYQNRSLKRFVADLDSTYNKILGLNMKKYIDEWTYIRFNLFTDYKLNAKDQFIVIRVHEEFTHILNKLLGNYTKFDLMDLVSLKSSYSKSMFRLLKQWETKKVKTFSLEELRELLGVPIKYNNSQFNERVLNPIKNDLKSIFKNFNIKKNKKGVKIVGYTFSWSSGNVDNEIIEYKEDDKKEVEISESIIKYINYVCDHNRFIKEVLDDEENLIKLVEKFEKNQDALIKGLEYASKKLADLKKEINLEYLIKTVRTGAGVKRTKKVLKIVDDEVTVPKEVPTEQPAPTVPKEDKVEVPKIEVEETNSELVEFEKLSREEQIKIEDTAIELYKKDTGVQANPILNMRNANIFKNLMKKYILQAMNGEEVLSEDKVEVEEQPIEQKEEKKVYTVEDIPADKLLSKAGKKLGGVALQARIEKILKEMNGE